MSEVTSENPTVEYDKNPNKRTVRINEKFDLLPPPEQFSGKPKIGFPFPVGPSLRTGRIQRLDPPTVTLETENTDLAFLPNLSFAVIGKVEMRTWRDWGYAHGYYYLEDFFTPLLPKLGYQITNEDYDLESRVEKLLRSKGKEHLISNEKMAKLYLDGESIGKILNQANLAEPIKRTIKFQLVGKNKPEEKYQIGPLIIDAFRLQPKALEALRRLRLQLFFPSSKSSPTPQVFESRASDYSLEKDGFPKFNTFYPLGKPLATATEQEIVMNRRLKPWHLNKIGSEGLGILIPPKPDALKGVQAMFVLAPQKQ